MTKHSRVAQSKWLLKQLAEKDEVIDVLKNPSAYFQNYRRWEREYKCFVVITLIILNLNP